LTAKGIAGGLAGSNVEAAYTNDRIEEHIIKGNEDIISGRGLVEPKPKRKRQRFQKKM
jgi:hypothetical protein